MSKSVSAEGSIQNLPLVVGVDLGGTQIRTAVLRGAELLSRVALLTGEDSTPEHLIPRIYHAIEEALKAANTTITQIAGIGIGAPGPLNHRTGIIFAPPHLTAWDRVPIRDIFQEHFPVPVFAENDANAAALGEYMFGAGRGSNTMVYLTISTGIGGGVIIDGKLMEGASGTAAELGHMTIDIHGERCNCGNIGCLERLASGTAIARQANRAIAAGQAEDLYAFALSIHTPQEGQDLSHINARTVAQAAHAGVLSAQKVITEAAVALGVGLVNIIHIFNPDLIILGGGVTQNGTLLMDPVLRIIQERTMTVSRDAVRIVQAELGPNVGLIGAGALMYYYA